MAEVRLIGLGAAARYADVHPRTVRRWISAGLLSGYRVGPRLIKVNRDELEQMITSVPAAQNGR